MVRRLPLSSLMLETDSPVLGPIKQVRNVPFNLTVSAAKIAEIKDCPLKDVLQVTFENTIRFFRLS